ncbi:MAG: hypothetical protein ISR95_00880 [Candidatus Marinimicrobia bacterium]|nr:hypothetical protein [Candidatus Neomarinimicrobiota bacterium]
MGYSDFTEMPIWQQSFELLVPKFRDKTTKNYPSDERFGLVSDMHPPELICRAGRSAPKELLLSKFYNSSRRGGTEGFGRFEHKLYINEKTKSILVESARNIIEELNALIHSLES